MKETISCPHFLINPFIKSSDSQLRLAQLTSDTGRENISSICRRANTGNVFAWSTGNSELGCVFDMQGGFDEENSTHIVDAFQWSRHLHVVITWSTSNSELSCMLWASILGKDFILILAVEPSLFFN